MQIAGILARINRRKKGIKDEDSEEGNKDNLENRDSYSRSFATRAFNRRSTADAIRAEQSLLRSQQLTLAGAAIRQD